MTATATPGCLRPVSTEAPARRLRIVLGANAAASLVVGVAGTVAAEWWADRLGIGDAVWVQFVSITTLAFAIGVGVVAARATGSLRHAATVVSVFDLAWVAGTIAVLAWVDLTGFGRTAAVVMGIAVLDFAALQLWFRSRMH